MAYFNRSEVFAWREKAYAMASGIPRQLSKLVHWPEEFVLTRLAKRV